MSEKPRKPLAELLRELDAELERDSMPIGARHRIELRIREHERPLPGARWRRWLPACTFAAGAALVLAVIGLRVPKDAAHTVDHGASAPAGRTLEPDGAVAAGPSFGAFAVGGDGCHSRAADVGTEMSGDCRLVSEQMTVQVWEHAIVEAEGETVNFRSGRALFDVEPVGRGGAPVRIGVSHGVIEVLGTRFAVAQEGDGGHVDLFEGRIRFHGSDGSVVDIRPGQRHAWGDALEGEPVDAEIGGDTIEVLPDDKPQSRRKRGAERLREYMRRVEALRSEGRFSAAIQVLREANRERWDRRTAQAVSYELAELLRLQGDRKAACRQLRDHERRFPDGTYDDAIALRLDTLECD